MPRRVRQAQSSRPFTIIAMATIVATLYLAQQVLIPLALAVLLAFLLGPAVRGLERARLGRVPSVLAVVVIAFGIIFGLGWVVGRQLVKFAEDLPRYQDEIVSKVQSVRGTGRGIGTNFERLGRELEKAANEPASRPAAATQAAVGGATAVAQQIGAESVRGVVREAAHATATTLPAVPGVSPANPVFSVVIAEPSSPIKTLGTYLGLVLGPLGTAGLVVVFVIFMLLEREDLRDRILRVISHGRYIVTTQAVNDAATRVSRYLMAQGIVNGSYGLAIALGLWVVGQTMGSGTPFPSFVLWAVLCGVLRFVPYVGPWIASAFPIAISLAVYPGFHVFFATAGMIIGIELITNNVMEPWLYGTSTGLSTVALLVAAVFWTWLWGPVGLLLSTPLTVCIVVMGKYVPQLKFLDVLLGDQPALSPPVSYYQRLLARDKAEAQRLVDDQAKEQGAEQVGDSILMPALRIMRRDRHRGDLTAANEQFILDSTREIIEHVVDRQRPKQAEPTECPYAVVGCASHHRAEELTVEALAALLRPSGVRTTVASTRLLPAEIEALVERENAIVVFIAALPPGGAVQTRYLCRRMRRRFPEVKIVVGYWGKVRNFDRLLVRMRSAGASYVTTSLLQSRDQIRSLLGCPNDPSAEVEKRPPRETAVEPRQLRPSAPL